MNHIQYYRVSLLVSLLFISILSTGQVTDTLKPGQPAKLRLVAIDNRLVEETKVYDTFIKRKDSVYSKILAGNTVIYLHNQKTDSMLHKNYLRQQQHYKKLEKHYDSLQWKHERFHEPVYPAFKSSTRTRQANGLKSDSLKIRQHLMRLKSDLQRMKSDSARQRNRQPQKEVMLEIPSKNNKVFIRQIPVKMIIRTTKASTVRIVTNVPSQTEVARTAAEWFREIGIELFVTNDGVYIRNAGEQNTGTKHRPVTAVASTGPLSQLSGPVSSVTTGNGNSSTVKPAPVKKTISKNALVIYIPEAAMLDIENGYNPISIENDIVSLRADLVNTQLKLEDVVKAFIKNKYGAVNAGNIKDAELDLTNCKFTAGAINKLVINSSYSNIKSGQVGVTDMKSMSDQYIIGEVYDMKADKSFGRLNILNLQNSITFNGSSADLAIRKIDASAKFVLVNNKYADVSLPVKRMQNFNLSFEGQYSNVFTPFDKVTIPLNPAASYAGFTKTAGKEDTKLQVSCSSCSVDFR